MDPEAEKRKNVKKLPIILIYLLIVFLIALIIGQIIWWRGQVQRSKTSNLLSQRSNSNNQNYVHQIDLLEARNGVVLMLENRDGRFSINIQKVGETGWRNISMSDFTVKFPSLSPDAEKVAYISEEGIPHIMIVSLVSNSRISVTTDEIASSLTSRTELLKKTQICNWSQIQWSPDQSHLAFFVCDPRSKDSYAVIADLMTGSKPSIVWAEDKEIAQDNRKLIWLDNQNLMVSVVDSTARITIIDVVKVQLPTATPSIP